MRITEKEIVRLTEIRNHLEGLVKREDGNDVREIHKRIVRLLKEKASPGFSPEEITRTAFERFTVYIYKLKEKEGGPCNLFLELLNRQIAKYASHGRYPALDRVAEDVLYQGMLPN